MEKSAVNSLLGTPVLVDAFDPNIWVYAYTNQIDGGKIEKRRLILKFKNNKLVQIK
jgi:outer membrane protein assembly factor BamE (lipoprotein component of BamABCDE complex)